MTGSSPRNRFVVWLLLAGVSLALFFTGEYRDLPLPLGGIGTILFAAAVWFSVEQLHDAPREEAEARVAPGEWQAWVGSAFVGAIIVVILLKAPLFLADVPISRNPQAVAAGRSIGTLFAAWLVLAQLLKRRWAGSVLADERDARIALVASQWARCGTAIAIIAIAVMLGFSGTGRLRELSYPFIAQLLMLALLLGLWLDQLVAAVVYWRDRRAAA